MTHSQVVGGGDGLHIQRVAVNILDKQLHNAAREWFSSLGIEWELIASHH